MQAIEDIPVFRTRSTGGGAAPVAKDPAPMFTIDFDPAPIAQPVTVRNPAYDAPVSADMLRDAGLFDVGQLAYYVQFVGQVVSDAQMTELYVAAHRNGFELTSEAQGEWWKECDYKVTGARFASKVSKK